jgi:hypothetical protein
LLRIRCEHGRRIGERIEGHLAELEMAWIKVALQVGKLTADSRTDGYVGATRVDEAQQEYLAAEIAEAHAPAVLRNEAIIGQLVAARHHVRDEMVRQSRHEFGRRVHVLER